MVAALLMLGGIISGAAALASAVRSRNPELAYRLAPWDGRNAALLARKLIDADASPGQRARSASLARDAMLHDPVSVVAASTLALQLQLGGNGASSERLMHYVQRLSRRDLPSQLWAIETAVGRGDVEGALRHYDIALRTSRRAPDILYPIMSAAIEQEPVRTALARRLMLKPKWSGDFLNFAAVNSPAPAAVADLFATLGRAGVVPSDEAKSAAINRLIGANKPELAWRYYALIRPGATRAALRNGQFTSDIPFPLPFDWIPAAGQGVTTTIERGEGGLVDIFVPAGVGGVVIEQMQMLPPGRYILRGISHGIDQPLQSAPYWSLTCRGGVEFGRIVVPNSAGRDGAFGGEFKVPSDCPVQNLALVARSSTKTSGLSGQIKVVTLKSAP